MKRLALFAFSFLTVLAASGDVQAADAPIKQEGRVWYEQNLTLAFTPNWSFTVMPGARFELARTREDMTGVHFLEFFIGPNFTYKWNNFTFGGSVWYYYMGYPSRGRGVEKTVDAPLECSSSKTETPGTCIPSYNFSHNLEIIPTIEYRIGRWSIYDRVIFHNTYYADVYAANDQRWGWGTILRQLIRGRYALTDRLGVSLADELFFGVLEDSDTKKLANNTGYTPVGYWKQGLRYNRTYAGIDFKVTPALTVAPSYMIEIGLNKVDSGDITDVAHNLFVVVTYVAKMFDDKK